METVRRWVELYNRRDFEGLWNLTDSDSEFRSRFASIESEARGEAGVHAYFEALDDAYERLQLVPRDFIDAGAAVVVVAHANWRGKGSGAQAETPVFPVLWLGAGKVFRAETFTDRRQALEAVGLSEPAEREPGA